MPIAAKSTIRGLVAAVLVVIAAIALLFPSRLIVPPVPKPANTNRARVIFFEIDMTETEPWARTPQVAGRNRLVVR
jgi:hypothetical protein